MNKKYEFSLRDIVRLYNTEPMRGRFMRRTRAWEVLLHRLAYSKNLLEYMKQLIYLIKNDRWETILPMPNWLTAKHSVPNAIEHSAYNEEPEINVPVPFILTPQEEGLVNRLQTMMGKVKDKKYKCKVETRKEGEFEVNIISISLDVRKAMNRITREEMQELMEISDLMIFFRKFGELLRKYRENKKEQ